MEEVLLKFNKLLKGNNFASLLDYLQKYKTGSEDEIIIYILPNSEKKKVYVKDEKF